MARTAASVKNLITIKDVTEEDAKRIRAIWRGTLSDVRKEYPETDSLIAEYHNAPGAREIRLVIVDRLIQTCGVEYLGYHKRAGQHVYYCNAGDAYAGTILFIGDRLVVGCWGDLVERNLIKEVNRF